MIERTPSAITVAKQKFTKIESVRDLMYEGFFTPFTIRHKIRNKNNIHKKNFIIRDFILKNNIHFFLYFEQLQYCIIIIIYISLINGKNFFSYL